MTAPMPEDGGCAFCGRDACDDPLHLTAEALEGLELEDAADLEPPPGNSEGGRGEWPLSGLAAERRAVRRDPHQVLIEAEVARLRARREARRLLDAEERDPAGAPELLSLAELLAEPEEPEVWRVEGWQPVGTRALLAAQFKAGKTTARDNLVRSLVDGVPWLGKYDVTIPAGTVAVLDTEMSRRQLRGWLGDQGIEHPERVVVASLKGRVGSFDLLDRGARRQWAAWLRERGTSYLILDCLRPVLDALGLDENHDAGRFLVAFDALLAEARIGEALVVHHMGHMGERSRGDSRLRDWPDVEWRMMRKNDDPNSTRFIAAFGRDVDIAEQELGYEPEGRQLVIVGGSRHEAGLEEVLADILEVLGGGAMNTGDTEQAAAAVGGASRLKVREGLKLGLSRKVLVREKGANNSWIYRRSAGSPQSAAGSPANGSSQSAGSPPLKGDGGLNAAYGPSSEGVGSPAEGADQDDGAVGGFAW